MREPPAAELEDLRALIGGDGLDAGTATSLLAKAQGACGPLGALANAAQAQGGKKLTLAQAGAIVAAVSTIRSQLRC